jgi:hypothetical protein
MSARAFISDSTTVRIVGDASNSPLTIGPLGEAADTLAEHDAEGAQNTSDLVFEVAADLDELAARGEQRARASWLEADFTCTLLHQPVRMICARPKRHYGQSWPASSSRLGVGMARVHADDRHCAPSACS